MENTAQSTRFSKAMLAKWVFARMEQIHAEHPFDSNNGYAQVERKDAATNRAYGQWDQLRSIADQFDLWDRRV